MSLWIVGLGIQGATILFLEWPCESKIYLQIPVTLSALPNNTVDSPFVLEQ
jgi:hypothetical protein